jgi:predicted 3-demethylubiquinone-9 3-methyltransferase (glyoxalase superfamily)
MKTIIITKTLTDEQIHQKSVEIFKKQKTGRSKLYSCDTQEEIEKYIKSVCPKIGDKCVMENSKLHFIIFNYFAGWYSWKWGDSYCIDVYRNGKEGIASFSTIQNIGHR